MGALATLRLSENATIYKKQAGCAETACYAFAGVLSMVNGEVLSTEEMDPTHPLLLENED